VVVRRTVVSYIAGHTRPCVSMDSEDSTSLAFISSVCFHRLTRGAVFGVENADPGLAVWVRFLRSVWCGDS